MVRTGHLTGATLLIAVNLSAPAHAEKAIDWFIELKREAKYARIASLQGARAAEMRPFIDAIGKLEDRVSQWDEAETTALASKTCLDAAAELRVMLYTSRPDARVDGIVANEAKRDACLEQIQKRLGR